MKLLKILAGILSLSLPAFAANYPIAAGASQSTIQSTINTARAASGANTVTFAAGVYNITSQMTIPCGPAGSSLTIQGPAVPYSPTNNQTAILHGSVAGDGNSYDLSGEGVYYAPCTDPTTIQYLEWNGGEPAAGGGGFLVVEPPTSNLTIQNNFIHGNQANVNSGHEYDALIWLDGSSGSGVLDTNDTIQWNIFGHSNDGTTSNADCGAISTLFTYQGGTYDSVGGNCVAIGILTATSNLNILNNIIHYQEQGGKGFEGNFPQNLNFLYNDVQYIHRIEFESQQGPGSINSSWNYNDFLNQTNPAYGSWGLSLAQNGGNPSNSNESNNVHIANLVAGDASNTGPGSVEFWGGGLANNNLVQGYQGASMQYGFPTATAPRGTWQMNYNILQQLSGTNNFISNEEQLNPADYAPPATGWNGGTINEAGIYNITTTSLSTLTSTAPAISPPSGTVASPLTVTLSDTGAQSSGYGPQGNTTIYYTTDGSTPTTSSANYCNASTGGTNTCSITVTPGTTVKAIGMWGSINQPRSYPAGYGFVPSAVVSATYASSGGIALSSVSLTNSGAIHTLVAGGTVQMTANCLYSNGVTTNCTTTDVYGNFVSTWASSNTAALTISSGGLMTGVAAGSANVTAVIAGLTTPAWTMTVSAATLPLASVALSTTGGITSLVAGTVNQLKATCTYSDSSTTNCAVTDAHGNVVNPWTSSAPSTATVSSSGVVTGVAAGSTNLTATVNPSMVSTQWGQTAYTTAGTTSPGYLQMDYLVLGTQAGGYSGTGDSCSFYLPSGTLTVGALYDCGLIVAPTPTTEATSWLCWWTYTVTSASSPGAFVSGTMSNCGTLTPGEALWVTTTTNQTGTSAAAFNNCGGTCNGGVPTLGVGTYPYYCNAQTYGVRTGLPSTLYACGSGSGQQASQYVTLGQPPIVSNTVPLTVTAPPPTLVSASLSTPGNVNTMTVGGTLQFAAMCLYSDSSTTNCTVPDVHGNGVTLWTTSNTSLAAIGAVGSATPGLATAIAAGTPTISANVGSVVTPTFGLTISPPSVSLTGISLATTGGVNGLFVGHTNQLIATCLYSDGSTTNCTTTDTHGNVAGSYASSSNSHATVGASTGLVTGVAAGATNLTATAGGHTSSALPLTVLAVPTGIYTITITGPVTFSGTVSF